MKTPLRVLIVEDSEDDTQLVLRELKRAGFDPSYKRVETPKTMQAALTKQAWDVIIADYSMPHFSGLAALKVMQDTGLDFPFILVSGTIGEDLAVSAMKAGAHDYLMKDNLTRLAPAIQRELLDAKGRRARRLAEEELRRIKEFNEDIVKNVFDGIYLLNTQGVFTYINPAMERMFGYSSDELVGKHWKEIVPPDQVPIGVAATKRREQGVADRYELEMVRKDGVRLSVLISGAPRSIDGQYVGSLAVVSDISEIKRMEDEARRLKEFSESIIQNMYEGVGVENEDRIFTFVNPAMAQMLGYSSDELIGQSWSKVTPADQQEIVEAADERRRAGQSDRYELDLLRKDGSRFTVEVSGSPRFEDGRFNGYMVVFTDVTARKQVQETLSRRAEELVNLHAASLTITAPHDFQSLVHSIVEQAKTLLKTSGGGLCLCDQERQEVQVYEERTSDGREYSGLVLKYGEGAAGIVAKTGKHLIIDDYRTWANRAAVYEKDKPYIATLSVPLVWHGKVTGVLQVTEEVEDRRFNQADVELLNLFADQAAIALENSRLLERVSIERRHLGLLYDLGRELAVVLDHKGVLDRALSLTCKAIGGMVGEAFLYDSEANTLNIHAIYGRQVESMEYLNQSLQLSPGKGLAGWVAQHHEAVNVADVHKDERWFYVPGLHEDVHSALVAPILDNERLLGVVSVLHRKENAFTPDHLDLIRAICHQVGLALNIAESYAQVQSLVDMLAAEQYRLESLLEKLPVGVLLLDSEFRLVVANLLGRQILTKLNPKESGQRLTHVGPYTIVDLCEVFSDVDQTQEAFPIEIVLNGPPRSIVEVEARSIGNENRQWVLTMRDVSQERESQEKVKVQERLATVGQLAAGIAHDFNNIMAAILVYTDLLMGDPTLPETGRERLGIIQQQVQRATSLIRQILDFSRRSVMEQTPMDLLSFIKELDKLLSRVLPETIHLELHYQPGSYLVNADPTRLQQVFMNLSLNARDAMPQGGNLRFELSRFHTSAAPRLPHADFPSGEWVRIEVSDTGSGISPEILPHIFDPFYTTKPVGKGTGLGLAQVYGIVKQHQGYIDVSSQVGLGSQFVIFLPALIAPSVRQEIPRFSVPYDGGGRTVLVVEDDKSTREAIQALLEAQNFQVVGAANGTEALKIFEEIKRMVSLVVSDLVMPKMDGVTLYQALAEQQPEVKILFVTGHPMDMRDHALLEKGNVHWLQKPFSLQEFNRAIQVLLE
jgi:PAS domain S-box-containing protein